MRETEREVLPFVRLDRAGEGRGTRHPSRRRSPTHRPCGNSRCPYHSAPLPLASWRWGNGQPSTKSPRSAEDPAYARGLKKVLLEALTAKSESRPALRVAKLDGTAFRVVQASE